MSTQTVLPEPLSCTMRMTQSNRTFVELIQEKERVDTMNAALSKIIAVARPFFAKRSSKAVQKIKKIDKKSVAESPAQQAPTEINYIVSYEEVT